jgi:type IV pilus assembly protein PilM
MEQFNKARGGSGLENVILYGFIEDYIKLVDALDGLDIHASVLGVPAQITGYENFEFTVFANAIGALYKRNKQTERINLLEVDQSTGKGGSSGVGSLLVTGGVFVAAAAIIVAAATLIFNVRKNSIEKDIETKDKEIAKEQAIEKKNKILHEQKDILQAYADYVDSANTALRSLPKIKKDNLDKIDEAFGDFTYEGVNYDITSASLILTNIEVDEPDQITELIDNLLALGLFEDEVTYGGYTVQEVEEVDDNNRKIDEDEAEYKVVVDSLTLHLKGEATE